MRKSLALPKSGTKAAKDFFSSWRDINQLLNFVLGLVNHSEKAASTAHKALLNYYRQADPSKTADMEAEWKARIGPVEKLKENRQLLLEAVLVRHIENFINYLSAVLFEIFTARPETLRSSDKVDVSKVLEHDSIESLVREIAEAKVDSLSYSSFAKMVEFFEDRFHITLASEDDAKLIHEYIEVRNISVHNRCYINKRFIARLRISETELGKKKELFIDDLDRLVPKLASVVKVIDTTVRNKMKVKGIRFSPVQKRAIG